jgi:hypothetical protein
MPIYEHYKYLVRIWQQTHKCPKCTIIYLLNQIELYSFLSKKKKKARVAYSV